MWSKACIRRYEDLEFGLEFRLILGVNEEHRAITLFIIHLTLQHCDHGMPVYCEIVNPLRIIESHNARGFIAFKPVLSSVASSSSPSSLP